MSIDGNVCYICNEGTPTMRVVIPLMWNVCAMQVMYNTEEYRISYVISRENTKR